MKTFKAQQEILLITTTTFSLRDLSYKNDRERGNSFFTIKEQLEEACWNGLLPDMLPEIILRTGVNNKLFIWRMQEGNSFLWIELATQPTKCDSIYSINPNFFSPTFNEN